MNILEVILKLILATALGGLVGLERESNRKPAGFRTNILICLGSTMVMILSSVLQGGVESSGGDAARIAAGVITGIGFIGAGTIIQARGSIVGLTSAATIWTVGILGLVIGTGYYMIALVFTGVILLTLLLFRLFEGQHFETPLFRYTIKAKSYRDLLLDIKKLALHEGIKFKEINHREEGGSSRLYFSFRATEDKEQKFKWSLLNLDGLLEIKID